MGVLYSHKTWVSFTALFGSLKSKWLAGQRYLNREQARHGQTSVTDLARSCTRRLRGALGSAGSVPEQRIKAFSKEDLIRPGFQLLDIRRFQLL